MTHIQQSSHEEALKMYEKMTGHAANIMKEKLTLQDIDDIISTINLDAQEKEHLMDDIETRIRNLPIEDVINQSDNYKKLKECFVSYKKDIETIQYIIKYFENQYEEKIKENRYSLKMSDKEESLAKSIVEYIKFLMNENFPNIKALISTNINFSILTLTEKPSSSDVIVEIGNFLNEHVKEHFSDIIDTKVIVTVGQDVNERHDNTEKSEKKDEITLKVKERFNILVNSGQIPKNKNKFLIPISREEIEASLKSMGKNDLIAIKSFVSPPCKAGDIVILCSEDRSSFISSPFIVEGESEHIFEGLFVLFLKKLNVRKVW